jgi:hypothetical protein
VTQEGNKNKTEKRKRRDKDTPGSLSLGWRERERAIRCLVAKQSPVKRGNTFADTVAHSNKLDHKKI